MKERILEFISHLGISAKEFERTCGRPNGFVNNLKDNMSAKTLGAICARYPQLDIQWVISGSGDMIRRSTDEERLLERVSELTELLASMREVNRQQNATIEALTAVIKEKEHAYV